MKFPFKISSKRRKAKRPISSKKVSKIHHPCCQRSILYYIGDDHLVTSPDPIQFLPRYITKIPGCEHGNLCPAYRSSLIQTPWKSHLAWHDVGSHWVGKLIPFTEHLGKAPGEITLLAQCPRPPWRGIAICKNALVF